MSYCNSVGIHKNQGLFDAVLTDYLWQQQEMPIRQWENNNA